MSFRAGTFSGKKTWSLDRVTFAVRPFEPETEQVGSDLPTDILSHAMFCLTGKSAVGENCRRKTKRKGEITCHLFCASKRVLRKAFQMKTGLLCFKMKESAGETHFHASGFTRRLVLIRRQKSTRPSSFQPSPR